MLDEFEGDFSEQRIVNWNLDFLVKSWLYPPIREQNIIKTVDCDFQLPEMKDENNDLIDYDWFQLGDSV